MVCEWCGKNEVELQLNIYHLRKEETSTTLSSGKKPEIQYLRDGLYIQVKICSKCCPVTSTSNIHRYKLRGDEIQQSQSDKNKK